MPEQPIPEQDPIVTKSYALHYVVAMVILMATLFWALWDEAFGQRPWKAYQHEWKDRYTAFLNNDAVEVRQSRRRTSSSSPEYQQLEQDCQRRRAKPPGPSATKSRSNLPI